MLAEVDRTPTRHRCSLQCTIAAEIIFLSGDEACMRLDCLAMRKFFSSPSCHLQAGGFGRQRNPLHVQDRSIAFRKASRAHARALVRLHVKVHPLFFGLLFTAC